MKRYAMVDVGCIECENPTAFVTVLNAAPEGATVLRPGDSKTVRYEDDPIAVEVDDGGVGEALRELLHVTLDLLGDFRAVHQRHASECDCADRLQWVLHAQANAERLLGFGDRIVSTTLHLTADDIDRFTSWPPLFGRMLERLRSYHEANLSGTTWQAPTTTVAVQPTSEDMMANDRSVRVVAETRVV